MRALRSVTMAVGLLAAFPAVVYGQGAIGGVVRDSSGAVLPGVTVEAASDALIERVRSAVTDSNGQYLIVDLRPGVYSVTFSLAGFNTTRRDGLSLSGGVTLPVNAELAVGTLQETVTVSGETPVVDVQNTRGVTVLQRDLLDSVPRARNNQFTAALIPGMNVNADSGAGGTRDVGGSTGENNPDLSIHGGEGWDMVYSIDGMRVSDLNFGGSRGGINFADSVVQEYVIETSAISAESGTGGVRLNVVPKEGGNAFGGSMFFNFADNAMTSDNLTDEIRSKGLTKVDRIHRIWDANPALGGPLKRDRLWFFTSYRQYAADTLPPDAYYAKDPTAFTYEPDLSRPFVNLQRFWSANLRLTTQLTARNKLTAYYDKQSRDLPGGASRTSAPEASRSQQWPQNWMGQLKWTSPVTNRLLLEAGFHYSYQILDFRPVASSSPLAYGVVDVRTGISSGAASSGTFYSSTKIRQQVQTAALSFITGSHALKAGLSHQNGTRFQTARANHDIVLRTANGVPFEVQLLPTPWDIRPRLNHDLTAYVQDQWKLNRVTINLGLNFSYINAQIDGQHAPAGIYVPDRRFDPILNVPNWTDLNPRAGVAYDVFGDGRTAVKTSLSRYVRAESLDFGNTVNPMIAGTSGTQQRDTRTWTDPNGDRIPQASELGPTTNLNFGLPVFSVRPDEDLREGWGKRGYNWEYVASVQQELFPGVSGTVSYHRRWYGNLLWTDNLLVTEADYTPFTVVSPLNGEPITMYNLHPAKRGLSDNLITFAPDDSRVYDGFDFLVGGRFGNRLLLSGGLNIGRTTRNTCTVDNPNSRRFCDTNPGFTDLTQLKFVGAYRLPYGMEVGAAFSSSQGPELRANYTVTSAVAGVPLTTGSLSLNLIEPFTEYGDRVNQLDLRLSKQVRVGATRVQGLVEMFNVLNTAPVLSYNQTYGPGWQVPTSILLGRMIKVGAQVSF